MEFIKVCPEQKMEDALESEIEIITLRDGVSLTIRPIHRDDAPRLQELFFRLSLESVYMRFLGFRKYLPDEEARCLTAVARYFTLDVPGVAEAAFVVEDAYQGRGLGTLLCTRQLSRKKLILNSS